MSRALGLLIVAALVCGCGEKTDESLAKRTGSRLGEVVVDFSSGVGQGVDKQSLVEVELSEGLSQRGFSKTVAKSSGYDMRAAEDGTSQTLQKGISVYLISQTPYQGKLIAKALDKEGREIGRSVVDVDFGADDAKYVKFPFEGEVDMQLAARFTIDIREETPAKGEETASKSPQ